MSVGTWQIRFGASKLPMRIGVNIFGYLASLMSLSLSFRDSSGVAAECGVRRDLVFHSRDEMVRMGHEEVRDPLGVSRFDGAQHVLVLAGELVGVEGFHVVHDE